MFSGSRFVFFSRGQTIVAFSMFGKLPSSSDMLHIFVMVPARSGTNRLMSHVGAGSNMQCFAGDAPTISKISSAVTGRKLDRAGNCLGSITGGLALDVDERILLTLFWKQTANSSGENLQSDVAMGWLISTPIFDQSAACRIFQAHDLGMKKTRKTWSAFT